MGMIRRIIDRLLYRYEYFVDIETYGINEYSIRKINRFTNKIIYEIRKLED